MKSQKFGISNLPFRNPKKSAQEQEQYTPTEEEEKEPTQEEQFASVVLDEEGGSDGEECELHVYE